MDPITILLLAGVVFLLIAVVGGGFEIKEIKIPVVPKWARIVSGLLGAIFCGLYVATVFQPSLPDREQPPVFKTDYVYPPDIIERTEFNVEPGRLPEGKIDDFLRLSRIAFDIKHGIFNVRLLIKNTGAQPILLDLDQRFFSLEDDQGRAAEIIYFCCKSEGDLLAAGQEREVQLFFQSSRGWYGKEVTARWLFFRVRGFLPLIRASWKMPVLATAD
jgi:hypothetical protein